MTVVCTFRHKESEKSPIGVLALRDLIKEAKFSLGVIKSVTRDGKVGAMLASHMGINKLFFTGFVFTGDKVNLKRVLLELGGKVPPLIFADADLNNVLQHSSQNFLCNTGQACIATSRTFVQGDITLKFIEELKKRNEQLSHATGDSADANTFLMPIVGSKQFDRAICFLDIGKQEAELVTGGLLHGEKGFYVKPAHLSQPEGRCAHLP
ncbi:hypothetical protein N0V90_001737 [Kalmusia sp. IMI 367209]|nr:hypothetical protein N0V90_001737 [Kalmusia sp. IMI 367209]